MQLSSSSAYINKDDFAGLILVGSLSTLGGSLFSLGYQQGMLPDKIVDSIQLLKEKIALTGYHLGIAPDNKSNTSLKVKKFISDIATKQGITNPMTFAISPEGYRIGKIGKTIHFHLAKEQEAELKQAIKNKNQASLNLHTSIIHHELTHIKRDPVLIKLLILATGSLIPATAFTF